MKKTWTWILLSLSLSMSCKEENETDYENLLLSQSWTQKIGLEDGVLYGQIKMFHEIHLRPDGTCTLLIDQGSLPVTLRTIETTYVIAGHHLLFPNAINQVTSVDPPFELEGETVDVYLMDWKIISNQSGLLKLKAIENNEKEGFILGQNEVYWVGL